jgi:uncharacterized protein
MDSRLLKKVRAVVGVRGGAHGLDHLLRVNGLCEFIAEKEGGDLRIVSAMALLHDVVRFEGEFEAQSVVESVDMAKELLSGLDYSFDEVEAVVHGIRAHSIHGVERVMPESLEAKILFDADKIDATGEVGVARWFMTMAGKNVSVREAAEIYLKEIGEMRDSLGGKLFTKTGTGLIKERIEVSVGFMKKLLKELG